VIIRLCNIGIVRECERHDLIVLRIFDAECIGLRDNGPVIPVEHFLGDTVIPALYNPLFGYIYILLLVVDRIVPQNERFVGRKIFKPFQKRLEQFIVICSLPHARNFIAVKAMQGRAETGVHRRYQSAIFSYVCRYLLSS
jgi:hypothetical protein